MRDPDSRQGHWYLLTGLIIGLGLGLVYAWVISPVRYVDTSPDTLRADFKDEYRRLIALAFTSNQDLGRAQARLSLLDEDPARPLAALAQRSVSEQRPAGEVQAVAQLAAALGQAPAGIPTGGAIVTGVVQPDPTLAATAAAPAATAGPTNAAGPAVWSPTPEPPTATPTITLTPTITPTPTMTPRAVASRTPTATAGAPYLLDEQSEGCNRNQLAPQIQVWVTDAEGEPVPGVQIYVAWEGGQDSFYTGLKPEVSLGYADFTMQPDVTYTVRVANSGDPVTGLGITDCQSGGQSFPGGWELRFQQQSP